MTTTQDTWTTADVRALVPAALFTRMVNRIATKELVSTEDAERIMTAALAFLKACALRPGAGLAPSERVDIGWHTFIVYTKEYAEFCNRVAGRFIHHVPDDDPTVGHATGPDAIQQTVEAMRALGLPVDDQMWKSGTQCSQCHEGCYDSTSS